MLNKTYKKAYPFTLSQVSLTPNTKLYNSMIKNAAYILSLDNDRLLYAFRTYAKLDTKGVESYGGWEGPWSDIRGEFLGHFICACVNMYESFKLKDIDYALLFKSKVDYIVDALRECQIAIAQIDEDGYPRTFGYLSGFSSSQLDDLEAQKEATSWGGVPYYVFHKTLMGLVDAYIHLENDVALRTAIDMAYYFKSRIDKLDEITKEKMVNTKRYPLGFYKEFGGMHDILIKLYVITKDEEILNLSKVFDRKWFRDMLIEDRDELAVNMEHANSEIPCVSGMATYYEMFGDENYKDGVLNFLKWMKEGHTFPTGGASGASGYPDYGAELFNYPNIFFDHVTTNKGYPNYESGESCCSHNINKIGDDAFSWTLNPQIGHEFEKRFVNVVLGQQHPDTGMFIYFQDLKQGSRKKWGTPDDSFWCCYCSGIEAFSSLTKGAYYYNKENLYINNYIDSTVEYEDLGLTLRTETNFPYDGRVKLGFQLKQAEQINLSLRIPDWVSQSVEFYLNGEKLEDLGKVGSMHEISRIFENGDVLEFTFGYSLNTIPMPDRPEYVAVKYGPNILAACTLPYVMHDGDEESLLEKFTPTGVPCEFRVRLEGGAVTYKPISKIVDEVYNGYTIISKPRKEIVIDEVIIGDLQSEENHAANGTNIQRGFKNGKNFVEAHKNGYIDYKLKVEPYKTMYLKLLYWGSDISGNILETSFIRLFDIQVLDESKKQFESIATQYLQNESPQEWYHINYPIPKHLTIGKYEITVRILAKPFGTINGIAGGIYEKVQVHTYESETC